MDLNGPLQQRLYPATVGDELCDPNDGITAQISLDFCAWSRTRWGTRSGRATTGELDPCTQDSFVVRQDTIFKSGSLLGTNGISAGDKVYLAIYYTPGGNHEHQLSFGACDETTGVCRQAYTSSKYQLEFWEFGIGAFVPLNVLTGGADNEFDTFSATS